MVQHRGNTGYNRDVPTPEVLTPNMDQLVADGVHLLRQYVVHAAQQLLSPSFTSFCLAAPASSPLPIVHDAHNEAAQSNNTTKQHKATTQNNTKQHIHAHSCCAR